MRVADEFSGTDFGDERLSRRLTMITEQLEGQPDASYPNAAGSTAALEATYRFLNNRSVTPQAILAPHYAATARRAEGRSLVIAHDSTEFVFRRLGMGTLGEGRIGFLGHVALAIALEGEQRIPLGVTSLETLVRPSGKRRKMNQRQKHSDPGSEELRWWRGVEHSENVLGAPGAAIHVMDREADSFELFSKLVEAGHRFVIRTYYDRCTVDDGVEYVTNRGARGLPKIKDRLRRTRALFTVDVPLTARKKVTHSNKQKPARAARPAKLACTARKVNIVRPNWARIGGPPVLTVNVVQVREVRPPKGCERVEWQLITTEAIETADQVRAIIDAYRARWVIEEYFRALKQGCAYERRQLENQRAIFNALAIFIPIAWQLLALRNAARESPDAKPSTVLRELQRRLLRRHPKTRLLPQSTARDAMLAIARLGGHIKNNGEPGWIVLGRGYERLLFMEEGARIAGNL
jgi:hypothetical protein